MVRVCRFGTVWYSFGSVLPHFYSLQQDLRCGAENEKLLQRIELLRLSRLTVVGNRVRRVEVVVVGSVNSLSNPQLKILHARTIILVRSVIGMQMCMLMIVVLVVLSLPNHLKHLLHATGMFLKLMIMQIRMGGMQQATKTMDAMMTVKESRIARMKMMTMNQLLQQ